MLPRTVVVREHLVEDTPNENTSVARRPRFLLPAPATCTRPCRGPCRLGHGGRRRRPRAPSRGRSRAPRAAVGRDPTLAGLMSRWMAARCARVEARRSRRPMRSTSPAAWPARQPVIQPLALHELHREEGGALVLADLVDGDDVSFFSAAAACASRRKRGGVGVRAGGSRTLRATGRCEVGVLGAVDEAHAAASNLRLDSIVRNCL